MCAGNCPSLAPSSAARASVAAGWCAPCYVGAAAMSGPTSDATTATAGAPTQVHGYPVWRDAHRTGQGVVEVRFVGRGDADRARDATLAHVETDAPPVAALRQVHSARV